ncbi:MAG: hypothetical protein ACKVG6_12725 [Alphaproteobacteria bacterium]
MRPLRDSSSGCNVKVSAWMGAPWSRTRVAMETCAADSRTARAIGSLCDQK